MKKLVLLVAIMLGAVTASQAGVRFSLGFGLPLIAPAPVVACPAPAPVYQCPPPVVYGAPVVCPPRVYYYPPAPSVYFGFGSGGRYGWGHSGWGHSSWGHSGWGHHHSGHH